MCEAFDTAVDVDQFAGDITRDGGGEKDNQANQIFGLAEIAEGNLPLGELFALNRIGDGGVSLFAQF